MAPAARREVSVMMENGRDTLGIWRMGVEEKMHFSSSNAFCWEEVQFQSSFFLVRRFRGATMLEKLGINFL